MKKLSFKEIEEIIRKNDLIDALWDIVIFEEPEVEYGNASTIDFKSLRKFFNNSEIIEKDAKLTNDDIWCVLYFKQYDVYIKLYGEFNSYGNNFYYNNIDEVTPQEKTCIEYITKNN